MKIYLTNQKNNFKKHLDSLKLKSVMLYDKSKLIEKTTSIDISEVYSFNDLNLDFFFSYQIFPECIMSFETQWNDEKREILVGDNIVQQVFLPPTRILSQKIVFGVRINEIINEKNRKGFSYETLEGHVEKGVSTFIFEQFEDKVIFKIKTFSTPGNILAKLAGPFFSVPYQTFCTKSALKNVERQIEYQ